MKPIMMLLAIMCLTTSLSCGLIAMEMINARGIACTMIGLVSMFTLIYYAIKEKP